MDSYKMQNMNGRHSTKGYNNPAYLADQDDLFPDDDGGVKTKKFSLGLQWIVLVVLLPIAAMIGLSVAQLIRANEFWNDAEDAQDALLHIQSVYNFVSQLQTERNYTVRFLDVYGSDENIKNLMIEARRKVDYAMVHVIPWPSSESQFVEIRTKDQLQLLLESQRDRVDDWTEEFDNSIDFYTQHTRAMLLAALASINLHKELEAWTLLQSAGYLMQSADPVSLELSMALHFLYTCSQTQAELIRFAELDGELQFNVHTAVNVPKNVNNEVLNSVADKYNADFTNSDLGQRILRHQEEMVDQTYFSTVCASATADQLSDIEEEWKTDFEAYYNLLEELTAELLDEVVKELDDIVKDAEEQFFIYIMVVALFALIAIYVAAWKAYHVYKMVKDIKLAASVFEKKSEDVEYEKRRNELLLTQIIPASLVDSLRKGKEVPVQTFHHTTIAYLDIVGFVALIVQHTPVQVVEILNHLYGMFDNLIESHQVSKIEQNNDVYCVGSGVPEATKNHAIEIANFLIDALNRLQKFGVVSLPDVRIKCRIGAHSGPCAAGIVGRTIPRYSVFGETVKLASRMSRTGEVMKIQISEAMKDNLPSSYDTEERGEVEVYGKGKMTTYFLNGRNM